MRSPTVEAMRALPSAGLLLDVDGPVASPETRRVPEGIIQALVRLGERGVPVVFNTGRSSQFLLQQVFAPLLEAGLPENARFHAVTEKAAIWFSFADLVAEQRSPQDRQPDSGEHTGVASQPDLPEATPAGEVPSWIHVDDEMRLPTEVSEELERLLRQEFAETMFYDDTKLAMVSGEMNLGESQDRFQPDADAFEDRVHQVLRESGLQETFGVEQTIISVDIEHVRSGKDLGAHRSWDLISGDGELPVHWYTCGDSRSDYAMADWLHDRGAEVTHVDARPSEGIPEKDYPVLTSEDLSAKGFGPADGIHETTGQALLEWVLDRLD